jgi:hypothetical protein
MLMKTIANSKFDITKYHPCKDALDWYNTQPDPITAWQNCPRGDWMLWIAYKLNINIHLLTLTKGYCVATVLHLMKDKRSINAVKVAIKFGRYLATRGQLYAAYADADAAHTADAYAAAYTADAYAAAYTAYVDAAYTAAKKQNQLQTADICRKYLTKSVMSKIKSK